MKVNKVYNSVLCNRRYKASLSMRFGELELFTLALIDTGAYRTHITYNLTHDIPETAYTGKVIPVRGMIAGHSRDLHEISIDGLCIGNVDVPVNRLYIAGSKDITVSLIGMDVLQYIDMRQLGNSSVLTIKAANPKSFFAINNTNFMRMLKRLLQELGKEGDLNKIANLLPNTVDMPYCELVSLVNNYYNIK